ncbi:calcium-binding protein [Roseomonas sp. CCTCC AB2023176]|uniref:calcium-binding protein n=1 Tax=Roseomonas sp. CCTCC AB2023176 TaxID=3342640 RepID=UPI0035E0ABA9
MNVSLATGSGSGGEAEGDTLVGVVGVFGTAFDDTLEGWSGADSLYGGAGSDLLVGSAGADFLLGDVGLDTVDYGASAAGVTVDLGATGPSSGGDAEGDVIIAVEVALGSAFADTLTASDFGSQLVGGEGDDTVVAGAGATRSSAATGWTCSTTAGRGSRASR